MIAQVTLKFPMDYTRDGHNKIAVIKALRSIAGLGLKEAKDLSESYQTPQTINVGNSACYYGMDENQILTELNRELVTLKSNGVEIISPINTILSQLRALATEAIKQGEDELANEILQLVLAEKIRRPNYDFC